MDLGIERDGVKLPLAPRPEVDPGSTADTGRIRLEYFPSLRSPYSAANCDRTLRLAEQTGVDLVLRPVLPMVMRGEPVTFAKGRYIFTDTWREAELAGVPFGRFVDPIGRPVENAFSLFPWARDRGRGGALLSAFLRCAFAEAVDIDSEAGMRTVVEAAGLPWEEAKTVMGNEDWRDELERNRLAMFDEMGIWGVPSYRVRGPEDSGEPDYATWGNDRLWRVAQEIRRRIAL